VLSPEIEMLVEKNSAEDVPLYPKFKEIRDHSGVKSSGH